MPKTKQHRPSVPWSLVYVILAFVSGLVATYAVRGDLREDQSSEVSRLHASIRSLMGDLEEMQGRLARLETQSAAQAPSTIPAISMATSKAPHRALSPDVAQPVAPLELAVEAHSETPIQDASPSEETLRTFDNNSEPSEAYDAHFEAEDYDLKWSEGRETRIRDQLHTLPLGSGYVIDAECRSTLCRIALAHPDPTELDDMMLKVMSDPELSGRPAYILPSENEGNGQLTIYIARKDHQLPESSTNRPHFQ